MPPKIKNDTTQMVEETARRLGVSTRDIKNEFHFFWNDVSIAMTHFAGHSLEIKKFGRILLRIDGITTMSKELEKRYDKTNAIYGVFLHKQNNENIIFTSKMEMIKEKIVEIVTRIILLKASIKEYEKEVLSVYPKKYKPVMVHLDKFIRRLEKHYKMDLSEFPIYIGYPLQKIFVRSLQKKGLLPNPVVYKNRKV